MKLEVRRLPVGMLEANCYLAWDAGAPAGADGRRPCLVIDPGAEPETILAALEEEKLRPAVIAATHCHADHIGAIDALLEAFPEAVWAAGEPERDWPGKPSMNLSYAFGLAFKAKLPTRLLRDGDELVVGCGLGVAGDKGRQPATSNQQLSFKALAVPGHSPGSIVYYCAAGKAVFTGDTLMAESMGRGDLPGGDERQLVEAIRAKILTLPDDTVVWPGHANRTRVGAEKKNNPCVGEGAG